jgi:exopolysaccharide biosynthesis operon protein EpsL
MKTLLASTSVAAGLLGSALAIGADAPGDVINGVDFTVGVRASYDDNLYRLPEGLDPATLTGPGATRSDVVERALLGVDGHWQWSQQKLLLNVTADHNRYDNNDELDNTAGRGSLQWDWKAGSFLSGKIGGDYSRSLANFANTRFLEKDELSSTGYFATVGFRLGPSWHLKTGARRTETEHSAFQRRFDDSQTDSVIAGLEYETSSENTIGVQARRSEATFQNGLNLDGVMFVRDYTDEALTLEVNRIFSPRTQLVLSAGYLQREYKDPGLALIDRGSFEGGIGEATLDWEATNKITLSIQGWRNLRAYLDSCADYFVALGGSVAATWTPTNKIAMKLDVGYETQDYLGAGVNLPSDARLDKVGSVGLTIGYSPLRKLRLELSGHVENRDSDRDVLSYDSQIASFGIRWTY